MPSLKRDESLQNTNRVSKSIRLSKKDQFRNLGNINCENVSQCLKYLQSSVFDDSLKQSQRTFFIEFHIHENLKEFNKDELNELCEKYNNNSIVILLSSENKMKFLIYWKTRKIKFFLMIKAYDESSSKFNSGNCEIICNLLTNSLQADHLGK